MNFDDGQNESDSLAVSGSVTGWYRALNQGDQDAAGKLMNRYFVRLIELARARFDQGRFGRVYDAEDAALSAFKSLCMGAQRGQFAVNMDRDGLWRLLAMITMRKVCDAVQWQKRAKRFNETTESENLWSSWLESAVSREPSGQEVAQFQDELEHLLQMLDRFELRSVALLKLEGLANQEIADRLGRGLSTIERKLRTIRSIWREFSHRDADSKE
jgi:DNA-directed RNA polymerase specialized sigma24 family protein